jgi:23S rRNA (uracil1939-C5)-methyltransferase
MLWEAGLSGRCDPRIAEIEFFTDSDDQLLLVEAYCPSITTSDEAQQVANTVKANLPLASGVTVFPSLGAIAPNSETAALAHTGASYLDYKADAASYRVSAGSFFQVNRYLVDELVKIVTRGRSGATALDLYAGVGLFSAVLSREFERVVAVESSLQAHSDLAYNVSANVKPVRASVQQYLQKGRIRADLIVVDPPRGGLGKDVAQNLAAIRTPELVYVSCDPATLARDVVPLRAGGYHVSEAHLVDLFPQTFHLESVLHLVR